MLGKIALEEAYNLPESVARDKNEGLYINPEYHAEYLRAIQDINDIRIKKMDATGVGYTIVSLTVPGCQGITDPKEAEAHATKANDWVAAQIKDHRDRLGAFAALSMHDPKQAGEELRRCVTKYGFHGALLNDAQQVGKNGESLRFYDEPEYDAFWKVCEELDVPVYFHPAAPNSTLHELHYAKRKYLIGPPQSFASQVSLHILGLISNGVFDRFPKLKIIVGHYGERIPFDLWRINHWFEDVEKPLGMVGQKTIHQCFKENIWVTTSGHFSTAALNFCISQLGADRILYSVDYPYETFEMAGEWYDNHTEMSLEDKIKIGRENAKKLLKIGKYKDCDAPVPK